MNFFKYLTTSLLVGFLITQLAYAQKQIAGVWIAQGMMFKDAQKIPAKDKTKTEADLKIISQNFHNRFAFVFDENGSFKAISTNEAKRIAGTWKMQGKYLLLASKDPSFNKEFGKSEFAFVGEMLDIHLAMSTQKNIQKYKPLIRFQKGDLQELTYEKLVKLDTLVIPENDSFKAVENENIAPMIEYKTLTLAISANKIDCQRPDKEPCLQVRDDANLPWSTFPYRIEGFEHTEGYEYILYVSERKFKTPPFPNNPQTNFYTLIQLVSKTKK